MNAPVGPYALPPLKFGFDALAPVIGEATMRLHHGKHHQAYIDRLNAALARHPEWHGLTIEALLRRLDEIPEDIRQEVKDRGGGHANHQFFWKVLAPPGHPEPAGALRDAIDRDFGSFAQMKERFEHAALGLFGSGWTFLVVRPAREFRLEIITLPNQDSLLIQPEPAPGLLACDLWEHAYYLDHHNRRAEWLRGFWTLVDWPYVAERYAGVFAGKKQL